MGSSQSFIELCLDFPDPAHVVVRLEGTSSGLVPFVNPLTAADRADLDWYFESRGAHQSGTYADHEAERIAAHVHVWSQALFEAVFHGPAPRQLFEDFRSHSDIPRILTVVARHPVILALPWELLCESATDDRFLGGAGSSITVRRCRSDARESRVGAHQRLDVDGRPARLPLGWHAVSLGVRRRRWRLWRRLRAVARWLRPRIGARYERFLETHRFAKAVWLYVRVMCSRPSDIERLGSLARRIATPIGLPATAAGIFGSCFTLAITNLLVAMPESSHVPANQLVRLTRHVGSLAGFGATAVAFVSIYTLAFSHSVFTAILWRLLALISPGGKIPSWRWFLSEASSGCAYIALFVAGTGLLAPYLDARTASTRLPLDRVVREHAGLLVVIVSLLVLFHQLQLRNIAVVDREIWGSRWKAVVATSLKLVIVFAVPWLVIAVIEVTR